MRKVSVTLFLAAGVLFAGAICLGVEKPVDTGKCFLWKATSETGAVYLLGTIHVLRDDMYPLDSAIEDAYGESEAIVLEFAPSFENQLVAAKLVLQKGMYPGEETIADHVSPETLEKLKAYLASRGMPFELVAKMRPWTVSMTMVQIEVTRLGLNLQSGLDMYFYQKASSGQKRVLELETVEEQVSLLADASAEVQELMLSEGLDTIDDAKRVIDGIIAAWSAGDAANLDKLLREERSEDERLKALEYELFEARNKKMFAKIERLLENKKTYFVMVGAGHVVGDEGIVKLLESKGYKVEQVKRAGKPEAKPAEAEEVKPSGEEEAKPAEAVAPAA